MVVLQSGVSAGGVPTGVMIAGRASIARLTNKNPKKIPPPRGRNRDEGKEKR
jgi:hypothetical protein